MIAWVKKIVAYLEYLKNQCGLRVSVHFNDNYLKRLPVVVWEYFAPYNVHQNAYCNAVKRVGKQADCIRSQKEILKDTEKGDFFCRNCHAGVREYIAKFYEKGNAVGFIAVSGYREKNKPQGVIDAEKWQRFLLDEEIPVLLCETLISPLCAMFEKVFAYYTDETDNEQTLILQFLNEYYATVTLDDVSKQFHRSKSSISHTFKHNYGVTFREYCNNLKLNEAKRLLLNNERSITDIAFDVGYNDASYFVLLFRKKFGVSPLQYRKRV